MNIDVATKDDIITAAFATSLYIGELYKLIETLDARVKELEGIVDRLTVCVTGVGGLEDK